MTSTTGRLFRATTYGESHGGGIGVVVDGCPPRLAITAEEIQRDLDRRRPGQSDITTQRKEADQVEILSGLFENKTLGSPIAMLVRNSDARSEDYEHLRDVYRPSHADFTTEAKYGIRNWQGGGRASARETIGRVAAGAVARKLLAEAAGASVLGWVSRIHTIEMPEAAASQSSSLSLEDIALEDVEASPTRCPHPETAKQIESAILAAKESGDSLGGIVTCAARGLPAGLGEPVFDKLDADLAKAMISLPAAKGFEVGSGFASVGMTGSQHNDPFTSGADGAPRAAANRSGGVQGGISNGEELLVRVAFKPTATIASEQQTVNREGEAVTLAARGRHDPCVVPRAVPLVEAMMCLVLADHLLRQRAVGLL